MHLKANMPQVSVIVPTLYEAKNLPALIRRISSALEGRNYEIVVIDDNSKDGTVEVCDAMSVLCPVTCVVRPNRDGGLRGAVECGFGVARGDIRVVMDADLQHPPEAIPSLITPILRGDAEVVVASRFVTGARLGHQLPWRRRLLAMTARACAAVLATGVADPMSGFFAITSRALSASVRVRHSGFKVGLEILCGLPRSIVVTEVPYQFATRHSGTSKMCFMELARTFVLIARVVWTRALRPR